MCTFDLCFWQLVSWELYLKIYTICIGKLAFKRLQICKIHSKYVFIKLQLANRANCHARVKNDRTPLKLEMNLYSLEIWEKNVEKLWPPRNSSSQECVSGFRDESVTFFGVVEYFGFSVTTNYDAPFESRDKFAPPRKLRRICAPPHYQKNKSV